MIVVANGDRLRYHPQHSYLTLGFAFFPVLLRLALKSRTPLLVQHSKGDLEKEGRPNEVNHSLSLLGNREPDERRTYDCGFTT